MKQIRRQAIDVQAAHHVAHVDVQTLIFIAAVVVMVALAVWMGL